MSNLSYASREAGLVLGERLVWRFPAMLALPSYGEIGPIGTIDVDATTGDIPPLSPALISQMQERANALLAVSHIKQRQESNCLTECMVKRLEQFAG